MFKTIKQGRQVMRKFLRNMKTLTVEDSRKLIKINQINLRNKILTAPLSFLTAYYLPVQLPYPLITRSMIGVGIYTLLNEKSNYDMYKQILEIDKKYSDDVWENTEETNQNIMQDMEEAFIRVKPKKEKEEDESKKNNQ